MARFRRIRRFPTAAEFLFFAALVFLAPALAPRAAFADPVNISVAQLNGMGRITFGWPSPVPFVAAVRNGQLSVQFGRPVEANLGALPGALARYFGKPTLSNGNRTVTFPLTGNFDLNYFPQGNAVIVELVDLADSPKAEPKADAKAEPKAQPKAEPKAETKAELKAPPQALAPAAPAATPAPAAAAPTAAPAPAGAERVGVRVGEHDTFLRIVFDWDKDVGAKIEHPGNRAVITFDRPANIAIAPLQRGDAKNVAGASTGVSGNSTIVTLNVPTSSKVEQSRSGPKVVVDVYNPTGANDAAAAATQPTQVPQPPAQAAAPASTPPAAPQAAAPSAAPAAPPPTAELKAPAKGAPAAATPTAPTAPSAAGAPAVTAVSGSPDEPSWRIDWTEPVGAAVFRRGGAVWIVFDRARQIDAAAATQALKGVAQSVAQVPTQRGTFIRIVAPPEINPAIRRDGFAWIFDFKRQPLAPQTPIEPKPEFNSPTDPHVVAAVTQPGEALPVTDPGVGDNLVVVPVIPLAYGVPRTYSYPQFDVLPSAQGVVVHPKSDDVRVRSIQRGVDLSGAAGALSLSPPNPSAEAAQRIGAFRQVSRIFTVDSWRFARRVESPSDFNKTAADLLDKVADAQEGQAKQKARLDYAQFLMGSDWGYEAMGVLDTMDSIDPAVESEADYRLLRGATEWLVDRVDEAEKTLAYSGLDGNDEGEFWRAIIAASEGKRKEAAPILKDKGNVFRSYPRALKIKAGIEIVDAAVAVGDINFANSYLQVLAEEKPEGKEIDELALREGAVDEMSGNFDGAVGAWEAVQKGTDVPSIAEATVRRANLLLQRHQIEPKEAIAELETLRFAWRGGLFEFNLLHRLGQLYMSVGDYRNGLRTLQEAVTYFRGEPETNAVADEMAKAFVDLYLNDQADSMPPVQAIALYDEFKELTPPGAPGDEMIRKLADRLASVDLLDRAAQILEDQVQFRLKGVEKARVGARLATVYLLNHEPGAAVAALDKSRETGLPADLEESRRLLQARGLVDSNRVPDAERALDRDETPEADELRAEVYWGQQNWPEAAKSLQKIVTRAGVKPNAPLDEQQAQKVLNFATAVALSGNERGIVKIGQDYGVAMNASPFKDAFNLIASPNANGLIDYRSVGDRVKTAANFTSFMDAYKKRLKDGKLSSLY